MALAAAAALTASLAVGLSSAGTAGAVSAATLDGGSDRFVTAGAVAVTGTDPGVSSGTVTVSLGGTFVANVWQPNVIGTGAVSADGTWSVDTLTGPHAAGSDQLVVMVPAVGGGEAQLMQTWWFSSPAADLAITSPAQGSTVTAGAAGCLNVTGHMSGTVLSVFEPASIAKARVGDTVVAFARPTAGPGPRDVTACLPVSSLPDGPVRVWLLVSDGTNSYVATADVAVDLTTTASLAGYGNGDVVTLAGSITDAGPDLALTATFDGSDIPVLAPLDGQISVPVHREVDVFTWNAAHNEQSTTQVVPDGPHEFHVWMSSRGRSTDLGVFPVSVDTAGRLTVDSGSFANGVLGLTGHYDNLPSPFVGQPLTVVASAGGDPVTDTAHETVVPASPSQYGRNTWSVSGLVVPGTSLGGPVDVTVTGLDHHAIWTCVRVSVTGTTVTPTTCDATPPGPPAAATVTASGIRTATVTVTPPSTDGGSPVTGYTVDYTPDFDVSLRTRITSDAAATSIPISVPWMSDTTVEVRAVTAVGSSQPVVLRLSATYPQITSTVRSVPLGTRWPFSVWAFSSAHPASTPLQVQYRALPTAAWRIVLTTSVGADATLPLSLVPTASGYYRVVSLGQGQVLGAESAPIALTVVPKPPVGIKVSATTALLRGRVTFSGSTLTAEKGNRIRLQRLVGGKWVVLTSTPVASTGRFAVVLRMSPRGRFAYRWVLPAWKGHPVGVSKAVVVRTR